MVQSEQVLEHDFVQVLPFILEFTKKLSKRVYPQRAMALVVWILCPLAGMLRHVSLI